MAVALTATLLLSACASTPKDQVRISVKRIALKLAFKNEELAKPVPPKTIINIIPAPPELVASGDLRPYRTPDTPAPLVLTPEPPVCPTAPKNATLSQAVGVTINEPPKPGWYRRHNKGTLSVTGGPIPITIPFPRVTFMEIRDVHQVERPKADHRAGDVAQDEAPPVAQAGSQLGGTAKVTRFTVSHHIATFTISDEYEYDNTGLRLVQRTTETSAGTSVFRPTPQITLVELGNFGNDWSEGGADDASNTAMVVRGAIAAQETVDVCGQLVDTLRYENDEQTVNLSNQETSGTSEGPNAYNIAPQRNGMIVRETKKFTQVISAGGAKAVINWDYVSTLGNFEPYPTRAAAIASLGSR